MVTTLYIIRHCQSAGNAGVRFQGRFDGGGHWIRNFTVSARQYPFAGLFGCVGEPGTVCSVHVDCVLLGK